MRQDEDKDEDEASGVSLIKVIVYMCLSKRGEVRVNVPYAARGLINLMSRSE